jgi:hypothetical protein
MVTLDCFSLKRKWGTVVPDRQPNQGEFHALAVALNGIDDLFEGREPSQEFRRNFMEHPLVQQGILKLMPAGKVQ